MLPPLKAIWLASDQLAPNCSRPPCPNGWASMNSPRLYLRGCVQLLTISPAQIDRLLRPVRVLILAGACRPPNQAPSCAIAFPPAAVPRIPPRPVIEADTVAHCGDTTASNFVYSLTFTDLYSGGANCGRSGTKAPAPSDHLQDIEARRLCFEKLSCRQRQRVPQLATLSIPHRPAMAPVPFTRSRAYRKNDNAHVEQKNWTHVRQLFGHDRWNIPNWSGS